MVKQTQHQLDWGKHAFPTWKLRGTFGEVAEDRQTRYSQHKRVIDGWERHIWEEHPWNSETFWSYFSSTFWRSRVALEFRFCVASINTCSVPLLVLRITSSFLGGEKERELEPSSNSLGNLDFQLRGEVAGWPTCRSGIRMVSKPVSQ